VTATFRLLPKCVVPKLEGKPLKPAEHAIRTHNCSVGRIEHASSRTIKQGRVISQKRNQGRRLKHGAKVSLVLSNGRL
jgi:beta-lactam-binding protein with PASTA domain